MVRYIKVVGKAVFIVSIWLSDIFVAIKLTKRRWLAGISAVGSTQCKPSESSLTNNFESDITMIAYIGSGGFFRQIL